jgi:hypothetical protein
MKITREKYAQFVAKLIPILVLSYLLQAYLYLRYAPSDISHDVVLLLGLALVGMFIYHGVFEHYHKITLHSNYLEVQFAPLKSLSSYFYRDIVDVEVERKLKAYQHVLIHLEDGSKLKLAYVDDAEKIRKFLLERS